MEEFQLISGEKAELSANIEKGEIDLKLRGENSEKSIKMSSDAYGNIELFVDGNSEGMVNVTSLMEELTGEERAPLTEKWNEMKENHWKSFLFLVKIMEKVLER